MQLGGFVLELSDRRPSIFETQLDDVTPSPKQQGYRSKVRSLRILDPRQHLLSGIQDPKRVFVGSAVWRTSYPRVSSQGRSMHGLGRAFWIGLKSTRLPLTADSREADNNGRPRTQCQPVFTTGAAASGQTWELLQDARIGRSGG